MESFAVTFANEHCKRLGPDDFDRVQRMSPESVQRFRDKDMRKEGATARRVKPVSATCSS